MRELKDFIKPPFANYDVVVYFGCGLFSLPLIYHYIIEPTNFRFPRFDLQIGIDIAQEAISILSLLFSVYVLGHVIAYCSSLFVEKFIDKFFGKISSAIILSNFGSPENNEKYILRWRKKRFNHAFRAGRKFQNTLRVVICLPIIPLIYAVNWTGGFNYYRSRVPSIVIEKVKAKMEKEGLGAVGLASPWFKILEHRVINDHPLATARMYNYLIISGIFRSITFLFLCCMIVEWYAVAHAIFDSGHFVVKPLMSDRNDAVMHLLTIVGLYALIGFCVASYMKFSRRYAEEAIFCYALDQSEPHDP